MIKNIKNDTLNTLIIKLPSENCTKVSPISIVSKKLGKIHTETIEGDHISFITTKLKDEFNRELGKEVFTMSDDTLYGHSIEVDPKYRNTGCRLGEILRLSSIIMVLENKINNFLIHSLPTAVHFHSKYKFIPYVDNIGACEVALRTMIINCNKREYGDIKILAQQLLNKLKNNNDDDLENNTEVLCELTNNLLEKYIMRVTAFEKDFSEHQFTENINMKLTIDDIFTNKDFFNDLFKKHKIDYQI